MTTRDHVQVGDTWPAPPPTERLSWPGPTTHVYPMKPTDTIDADGTLHSGAFGRPKAAEHDEKIVIQWLDIDHRWVVRRVPAPSSAEASDRVPGKPALTEWRRGARRHQSEFREARGWPAGRAFVRGTTPTAYRPIGSRVNPDVAESLGCNFIGTGTVHETILAAVRHRLHPEHRERHETIDEERLWSDLLSSMPMCFNLLGPLWADPELVASVVTRWFPDSVLPDATLDVNFEWSPGRRDAEWLGDRTAFDAMIQVTTKDRRHLIGIETKYHEAAAATSRPAGTPIPARYLEVTEAAGLFSDASTPNSIWGTPLEQVWRDHMLALACRQHPHGWDDVTYVLVAPAGNPEWKPLVDDYVSLLRPEARSTIGYRSLESLLDDADDLLPHAAEFRDRYLAIHLADQA